MAIYARIYQFVLLYLNIIIIKDNATKSDYEKQSDDLSLQLRCFPISFSVTSFLLKHNIKYLVYLLF